MQKLLFDPDSVLIKKAHRDPLTYMESLTRNRASCLRAIGSFDQRVHAPLCKRNSVFMHHEACMELGPVGSVANDAQKAAAKQKADLFMSGLDCCTECFYYALRMVGSISSREFTSSFFLNVAEFA